MFGSFSPLGEGLRSSMVRHPTTQCWLMIKQGCDVGTLVLYTSIHQSMGDKLFVPLQKLVYSKHYDSAMKACCRGNKNVDEVMELPQTKEDCDRVVACRENKLVNEQAKKKTEDEAGSADEETPLAVLRKPATDFKEHSLPYWKAMANTSVRGYVTFAVKPGTQSQMTRLVSQSALKDIVLNEGSKYPIDPVRLKTCF